MLYQEYVNRIAHFAQTEVLMQASLLSWRAFSTHPVPPGERENHLFIRAYAPRVFAISGGATPIPPGLQPNGTDLLQLCRLILEVDENVSDQAFLANERAEYRRLVSESQELGGFELEENVVGIAAAPITFLQRTIRAQLDSQYWKIDHVVRSWLIFKELDDLLHGMANEQFRRVVGQDAIDAYRSGFAIFSLILARDDNHNIVRAFIDLSTITPEANLEARFNINADTLRLVASRLSIPLEHLPLWFESSLQTAEYYRKYYPLPFYKHPLVEARNIDTGFLTDRPDLVYVCPCPWLFLAGLSDFAFRCLQENEHLFPLGTNLQSLLGDAIENYLFNGLVELFGERAVTRIADRTHPNADFIVEIENAIFVIECKKTISNALGRTLLTPEDHVKIWEKLTSALRQCSGTIGSNRERFGEAGKPVIVVIVANENVIGQTGVFSLLAQTSDMLRQFGVEQFEVVSLDGFEKIFWQYGHAAIATGIMQKWQTFRERLSLDRFPSLETMGFGLVLRRNPGGMIRVGFEELFPGLDPLPG